MKIERTLILFMLCMQAGCNAGAPDESSLAVTAAPPTPRTLTPIPLPEEHLSALAPSAIARVWANSGEDKVTRDELRASLDPNAVLNADWDGTAISLFGARNEVVAFNLVLEAPETDAGEVEVRLESLEGADGASITTSAGAGADPFDYRGLNIELFFVRYLEIKGISTDLFFAGYDYDERHIPARCRRPLDTQGEPAGGWVERPCHNRLYPEIAVPLELETPFDIPAGSNQSIWGDVYIPRDAPPGEYRGAIEIREHGSLTWAVPLRLQVYDFTLPDLPAARTMLYVSLEDIADRYLDAVDVEPGSEAYTSALSLEDRHFQLAHRHKISLIDDYLPVEQMDAAWGARLDGTLFTTAEGYDGVGVGVGNNVYSIGTYGSWPWQDDDEQDMWAETDAWVNWFEGHAFETPTEVFLYLIDESDDYRQIERWAHWIEENPGPGNRLHSLATLEMPEAAAHTPSLDIPASWARFGVTEDWQRAAEAYHAGPDKRIYLYNSNRPATGSFAIEDEGVALRQLAWAQYKLGIDRWFYWDGTYYNNYQCYEEGDQAYTDVFSQAQTYGCLEAFDESLGETGWNYLNGDGVLFYPGTDTRYPERSYDAAGPFASLRLKIWRRGIQDVDYLSMAVRIDPGRTRGIVEAMVPVVLWEVGVSDPEDPTYVYADIGWPTDPDIWEAARKELAEIIERGSP